MPDIQPQIAILILLKDKNEILFYSMKIILFYENYFIVPSIQPQIVILILLKDKNGILFYFMTIILLCLLFNPK